jgi:flagellar hook-length control protein FliK
MNCTDVMTLARAAPEPASSSRESSRDTGNSFDQFLQAVSTDHPTSKEDSGKTKSSDLNKTGDDHKDAKAESIEPKQVKEKQETKPESKAESQENESKADNVKEIIAAAVAAQVFNAVIPIQQAEVVPVKAASTEGNVPAAVIPVQPGIQNPVIQLPDTEPQPLPDELKQAVQQPKVEVKDFQTLVDAAAKNLENQAPQTVDVATATKSVAESTGIKNIDANEPVVKLVDLKAQPEDLAAMETSRNTGGLYALASAKAENLIQPKTLPMIREISQEVANLVREQGQSMRIQVHPENMGKIDLRLISNSDGLRVIMTAEVPATAKLLEAHMDQLQRSLAESGLSLSGMSVDSQGAQGQPNNQALNQPNQGQVKISRSIFLEESDSKTPVPVLVSSSGLDYRV